jgi:uncharacterized radical SAM superfamily Fe-S cluster-containing enzyme
MGVKIGRVTNPAPTLPVTSDPKKDADYVPDHGTFEGLVYGDAQLYTNSAKFNKPGTIPVEFSAEVKDGCPHDCGLCPDHQQHACLGIIEVNSACDMACPLCFADAGPGFSLTLEEVEDILDTTSGPKAIPRWCNSPEANLRFTRKSSR